jgi:flavodoxin
LKAIVVYYSLSGNTKLIAQTVARELHADLCGIETQKAFPRARWLQMVICGAGTVFKRKPELKGGVADLSPYDLVVLGCPVWAGSYATPMATFLATPSLKGKRVAVFASSGGGEAPKFMANMAEALADSRLVSQSIYKEPLHENTQEQLEKAKAWAGGIAQ